MPIKFSCQHCRKPLSVKDELAGKQGKCPSCKQVILIPQQHNTPPPSPALGRPAGKQSANKPASKAGLDLEALAAAMLSEKPVEEAPAETETVDFTCPWCDTEIHIPAEFAGKQAPCTNPECKRIVKVPMLKKTGPRDWRKPDQNTMPSGAKRDDVPLEGAWDSQAAAGVSRKALVEAAVIKEKREPITVRAWILRGLAAASVLCLVLAVAWFYFSYTWANLESRALQLALSAVGTEGSTLSKEDEAVLETGLAEYYLNNRSRDPSDRSQALIHLQKAKTAVAEIPADAAGRGPVLRELLHVQLRALAEGSAALARIPGTSQAKEKLAVEEADLESEFADTLGMTPPGIVRDDIVRGIVGAGLNAAEGTLEERIERLQGLIRRGIKPTTIARAAPPAAVNPTRPPAPAAPTAPATEQDYSEQVNALGILGQQLALAGHRDSAIALADTARRSYKSEHPVPPQFVGLVLQLNRPELDALKAGETTSAGQVAGYLRANKLAAAERVLEEQFKASTTDVKIAALLDAADVLRRQNQPDKAKTRLEEAGAILSNYPKSTRIWERLKLIQLDAAVNSPDSAKELARNLLEGPGLNYARADLIRAHVGAGPNQALNIDNQLSGLDAKAGGYAPVVQALARRNARSDFAGVVSWAEQLEVESARAFGGIGALLGREDAKRGK